MSSAARPGTSTQVVLAAAAAPTNARCWEELVRRYSGVIYAWCLGWGLQPTDAEDLTQDVFLILVRKLQTFDWKRARFRTWLHRVVWNAVRRWRSRAARRQREGSQAAMEALESEAARCDLEARLDEEFDQELVELAETKIRLKVSARYWECYRLFCKEGLSLREASAVIGISGGHVSKYASRVKALIAQEIARRDGGSKAF
jgi:RNA polymerase sigma-70 factor, ECF subfamily